MMRYRALLVLPNAGREDKPQQSFANSLAELEEWAILTLATTSENAGGRQPEVVIEETVKRPACVINRSAAVNELERRAIAEAARNQAPERRRVSPALETGEAAK